MSKHTIPTELNIAPRGKSWLHGQLIDGEHGHPTRQSMESAELAALTATTAAGAPALIDDKKQELMDLYNEIMKQGRGMHYWNYAAAVLDRYRNALAATPAAAPDMVSVKQVDANNYCRILAALGMEEEGDPVAKVQNLLATSTRLVLDYPWRDRLLDGRELVRDQQGFAEHPELPLLDEGMKPRAFFASLGVEMKHTMAEDDLSMDEYDAMSDAENWSAWIPRPPIGDAWNLVAIFDTEDGPAAWWARALKESREASPQAQADARDALTPAARDVLAERQRQITQEGYDPQHDDDHVNDEIAAMAALFIMPEGARDWDATSTSYGDTLAEALLPSDWEMPNFGDDRRRQLVKGTAMGLAEIERIDRAAIAAAKGE
ncbi:hypothetical protein N5F13_00275 [Comamonas thiooxydans]|uniref:hypothetical protein n=1 Tax=Comamonas thiooxydans TaxID=363952 RepID=UPI0024473394|nr:hypothetical protein [Comamonas thiooxydans]MDH1472916.1 hypothetical protein [Comamonas thiooxydans]